MGPVAHIDLDDLVIGAEATIRQALQVIDQGGLETALVCGPDRRLLGVLTDGDIRRALLAEHDLVTPIGVFCNRGCVTAQRGVDRSEALLIMLERQIKCIPVIDDDGKLVDLFSLYAALRTQACASWAVVMAGGFGTRLGELTKGVPKPMLPIGDRPILQHIVEHLVSHGVQRIFLSVSYLGSMIEDHFGDGRHFRCRIEYLREEEPLGTGGPLSLLPEKATAPVLVMNGDLLTRINVTRLLAFHRAGDFAATMALSEHTVQVPFGVAEVENVQVAQLVEKPSLTYRINAGIYVFDPAEIARVPARTFFPITRLLESILAEGRAIGAYHMQEPWSDIGLPAEFAQAQGD